MNLDKIITFCKLFNENKIVISNPKLNHVLRNYSFFLIKDNNISFDQDQKISQNLQNSCMILINEYSSNIENNEEDQYFIISFKQTIIFIKQKSISFLSTLFSKNPSLKIFYFNNTKESFDKYYSDAHKREEFKPNINYKEEINNFNEYFIISRTLNKIDYPLWQIIRDSITGYLIQQSYFKHNNTEIYNSEQRNEIKNQTYDFDEFIELRTIDKGSLFAAKLIYHIESERIFVCKYPYVINSEVQKLINREISNYSVLDYPFFPKFYGIIKNKKYPIIEYIDGKTLMHKDELNLSDNDKLNIIFKIIAGIAHLHQQGFVYRDLKPNNIIIDKLKRPIIIDFDRMILIYNTNNKGQSTTDFSSEFIAPEVLNNQSILINCDIFSIGQIISFLFQISDSQFNTSELYSKIKQIYIKCTNHNYDERPSTLLLMYEYYYNFKTQIDISIFHHDPIVMLIYDIINNDISISMEKIRDCFDNFSIITIQYRSYLQNMLGIFYLDGSYVKRDINKAIYYFSLSASQNDSESQMYLGYIYSECYHNKGDINKAIYYFSLSANQNNNIAQFNLGKIYSSGEYITPEIDKAIYYYSLAANQNNILAQFNLGLIYYESKYATRDIKKAIYYFSLAANQNYSDAQFNLGIIYYEGNYVTRDINKAIYYLSLAANQNYLKAQYSLGYIYYVSQYIAHDIEKAIHYFLLAANQNCSKAQYFLGLIYFEGKHITRDINRAIYYFSLAAAQNDSESQFYLGCIYSEGTYIKRDINNAIHYYTLSANQNNSNAQYNLGFLYLKGEYITRDITKAIHYIKISADQNNADASYALAHFYYTNSYYNKNIDEIIHYLSISANKNNSDAQYLLFFIYFTEPSLHEYISRGIKYLFLSANNDNIRANFVLGYLYQEGKYLDKDIKKSIYYYKKASSFNNQFAKNNLGVIYKNGYLNVIDQQLGNAIEYFQESIRQTNDKTSMYNLSTIYIFYIKDDKSIEKSIDILIDLSDSGFNHSLNLLIIALIKRHGYNIDKIKQELIKRKNKIKSVDELISLIIYRINFFEIYDQSIFEKFYNLYQNIDFLYIFPPGIAYSKSINSYTNNSKKLNTNYIEITSDFYEGFGIN